MLDALLRWGYLLAVAGGVAVFMASQSLGGPTAALLTAWSAILLGAGALAERLRPFERRWRQPPDGPQEARADWTSAAVLLGLTEPLLQAALPLLATTLRAAWPVPPTWPLQAAPLAVQIVAALLWMELAKYGSHRLHHRVPLLWPLHALHHAPRRLNWLNNLRMHPLNHAINSMASLLPLLVVGAPPEVILGVLALTQPVLMLQHANVRSDNGWINAVLSTNEAHRWHHAVDPRQADANYGSALLLWDHIFGTYRPATADTRPDAVGLFATARFPVRGTYLQQLLAPLLPPCCRPSAS